MCNLDGRNKMEQHSSLPRDYLKDGYFDKGSELKDKMKNELLLTTAQFIADNIKISKPELRNHQLRRFFDYCRNIENRLKLNNDDYARVETDVVKLVALAADAHSKKKIPRIFYHFISENVRSINGHGENFKAFMQHFEAVVAFYAFLNPKP